MKNGRNFNVYGMFESMMCRGEYYVYVDILNSPHTYPLPLAMAAGLLYSLCKALGDAMGRLFPKETHRGAPHGRLTPRDTKPQTFPVPHDAYATKLSWLVRGFC